MRILLVDDLRKPRYVEMIKNYMDNEQAEVVHAKTYKEGLKEIDENGPWDLLVLDNDLGGFKEGYDLACHVEKTMMEKERLDLIPKAIYCCSGNPVAKEKIDKLAVSIAKKREALEWQKRKRYESSPRKN